MKNSALKNISFGARYFDAAVCLDADLPDAGLFRSLGNIPLIAADGAANKLSQIGAEADYIVGDLDSFRPDDLPAGAGSQIIRMADQESNDFEKALNFAASKNYGNILVLGIHGGDLEHTLNNWSVFSRYSKRLELCLLDKNRYAFSARRSFSLETRPGETISLIPQPKATATTKNLQWKLDRERLEMGRREGARNKALGAEIEIHIHEGELLVFFDSRAPFAPEENYL